MVLPAISTIDNYGGELEDFAPVTDPTTDRAAADMNAAMADVAMLGHCGIRAWCRFTAAASTGAMVLVAHDAMWGNTDAVKPTLARSSSGVFTLTWPTSVTDELGDAHTLVLRAGWGNAYGASNFYEPRVTTVSANVVTVTIKNSTDATPNDAATFNFDIFMI